MTFELRSNRGDVSFTIDMVSGLQAEGSRLLANLHLRGSRWDGDHDQPIEWSAEEVPLQLRGLEQGLELLEQWLLLPLEALACTPLALSLNLGKSLKLDFADHIDASSSGHLVATVRFDIGFMKGEFQFETDQSCLRLFCESARSTVASAKDDALDGHR